MPARRRRRWNDDVERVRKGRPAAAGFGQRHRDAARAAGRAAAALCRRARAVRSSLPVPLKSSSAVSDGPARSQAAPHDRLRDASERSNCDARHMGARDMRTRDMRVAGMGACGGRHELDGDQHDHPPDQSLPTLAASSCTSIEPSNCGRTLSVPVREINAVLNARLDICDLPRSTLRPRRRTFISSSIFRRCSALLPDAIACSTQCAT